MRVATAVILCAVLAGTSGFARFWSGRQYGAWVDVVFLTSTAGVVALVLVVIMERVRRINRSHFDGRHPGES